MLKLVMTVYGTPALERLAESLKTDQPEPINSRILSETINYSITKTRDTLSELELMVQDPRTIRGDSAHLAQRHAKQKVHLTLDGINRQTESIRGNLFAVMEQTFAELDYHTNRLGAAVNLLATWLLHSLVEKGGGNSGEKVRSVMLFSPEAQYNSQTGKIEYAVPGGEHVPLPGFTELNQLRSSVGDDVVLQSLLELKVAGAALGASINPEILRQVNQIRNYPGDPHSEVMDATQAVEGNLGFLSTQQLPANLRATVKRAIPGMPTRILQTYAEHKLNPWVARFAGVAGLTTGIASAILGGPQLYHWLRYSFDLEYNPVLPVGYSVTLFLSGEVVSTAMFYLLTLGSDIGSKLVRDARRIELRKLKEL